MDLVPGPGCASLVVSSVGQCAIHSCRAVLDHPCSTGEFLIHLPLAFTSYSFTIQHRLSFCHLREASHLSFQSAG